MRTLRARARLGPAGAGVSLLALLGVALLTACADQKSEAPDLLPLSPASVAVNETLRLPLLVSNPSGAALTYAVRGPDLPGLAEVSSVSGGSSGGEFRWTPLASHVGTHEFTFTVSSSVGDDSESVLITVTPGASAAPVFLRPGAGGTYDLARDPCVRFDVEVRDDDSPEVSIAFRGEPVDGALLDATGPKQADFQWCPTLEQADVSDRWTIALEADDGDHAPTPHDYLAVLRTNARDNCEGSPPEITVRSPGASERVESASGYRVSVEIRDDVGVRDAPLLYYSTVKPDDADNPDVTEFSQAAFTLQGSAWEAIVPPLGLAAGEERVVYYVVSVTDNDDPTGTACDHRTETPLRDFTAVGGTGTELAADCELCGGSSGCESGICAASGGGGGVCLPACTPADDCGTGSCAGVLTLEGGTVDACGGAVAYCEGGGGGECVDDALEDNDTRATASPIGEGTVQATFCDGDTDFYAVVASAEGELAVVLDGFDPDAADLDLELLDAAGARLDISGGLGDTELVSACVEGGDRVVARVYSVVPGSSDAYALTVTETPGDCCVNDANEPDPLEAPTPIAGDGNFAGVICPGDRDHHSFSIAGPTHVDALIVFTNAEADLDLELYGPAGNFVAGSYGTDDDEEINVDLGEAGVYTLRIEPYDDGATEYLGQVMLEPLAGCLDTSECPIGTMCDAGICTSDACLFDDDCPVGHFCPLAGPDGALGHCVAPCAINTDCRDEGIVEEACKRFTEGRGCGLRGSGANGEGCEDFTDCGGQRACVDWAGGYCARLACTGNADCESDTFCATVGERNVCIRRCGGAEPACRTAEGYVCAALDVVGGGLDAGCVPE